MSCKHQNTRKSSDAENIGLKPKPYRKLNRLTSANTLRDSSVRRRNRVISGLSVPKFILNNAKRQKAAAAAAAAIAKRNDKVEFDFLYAPPTPPASPLCTLPNKGAAEPQKISLRFPRRLERPASRSFNPEALRACDPEGLKDVPVEYVRRSLTQLGPA